MGYRLLLLAGVAEWVTGYCCEQVLQSGLQVIVRGRCCRVGYRLLLWAGVAEWVTGYCCGQVWKRLDSLVSLQGLKRLDSLVGFAVVEDSGQRC